MQHKKRLHHDQATQCRPTRVLYLQLYNSTKNQNRTSFVVEHYRALTSLLHILTILIVLFLYTSTDLVDLKTINIAKYEYNTAVYKPDCLIFFVVKSWDGMAFAPLAVGPVYSNSELAVRS